MQTSTSHKRDRNLVNFWFVQRLSPSHAALHAVLLNKKLRKAQLQTFDRLLDDEINALETLNAKLVEPSIRLFRVCKVPIPSTLTHEISILGVSFCRNN